MSFADVAAGDYDRFMGRFSAPLAGLFADFAGIAAPARALDVGCGTGALTRVLAGRLGPHAVAGVDPAEGFVAAVRDRLPGVDVRVAAAEDLPFEDDAFDATLSELVVHFLSDPDAAFAEMVRVTRTGGVVAACVWDFEHDRAPHSAFLRAVRESVDRAPTPRRPGTSRGDLAARLTAAGCRDVVETELTVTEGRDDFDAWWEVHALGIGSTARMLDGLDDAALERVRMRAWELVGSGPITTVATAWAARGTAP